MKLLIEPSNKNKLYLDIVDGVILPLDDLAVESNIYFTLEEIEKISKNYNDREIFVKINKNLMNDDIDKVKDALIKLDKLKIKGIFFYDLAILQLKKELNLDVDLVWNQTHMVNNYKTCNYYFEKGVKYALLGKEITLDEIKEILEKSKIISMVEVVSRPSVAFSKRKLVSNYLKNEERALENKLTIKEKITDTFYDVVEDKNGTSFYLNRIMNGTSIIKELFDNECSYIIFREYGLEDNFFQLIIDTKKYILNGCLENDYVDKYKILGDDTNFFFKKTIYRVKKNG